ncbi:MAG TPA: pyruvate dehydrogenase (acetyl-transferring) E1 component subunit alpha [Candidatus Udaeobacter sp.]|nr:pyruvate dehydrogenase (acetyl-transferring) E1 component subunit alpha [Candidatus Udaeobacter sp.]
MAAIAAHRRPARGGIGEIDLHQKAQALSALKESYDRGFRDTDMTVRFEIGFTRYLAPNGKLVPGLPPFAADAKTIIPLYEAMVRARVFDAKAVALWRTGRLGTFASSLGQEAVAVGAASAMQETDVLLPSFREHGAQLWRGVTPVELLLYWGGDERGSDFKGPRQDFPVCVPVASHVPHAVGVALACKLRRERRAALCILGDGATSKGDVAEALNIAGVWRLPVVFVINNNQWAISVPVSRQTAAETLAQKGIAAGIPSLQVDGNDVVAVRMAVAGALERARTGGGASLIEAITYRLADHTTADDASRYRDDADVSPHWLEEPLIRVRTFLTEAGLWSKKDEEHLLQETTAEIEAAATAYLGIPTQNVSTIFDYTFEKLPEDLVTQRQHALGRRVQSAAPPAVQS